MPLVSTGTCTHMGLAEGPRRPKKSSNQKQHSNPGLHRQHLLVSYREVDPCSPELELGAQMQVYTEGSSSQSQGCDLSTSHSANLSNTSNVSVSVKRQPECQWLY